MRDGKQNQQGKSKMSDGKFAAHPHIRLRLHGVVCRLYAKIISLTISTRIRTKTPTKIKSNVFDMKRMKRDVGVPFCPNSLRVFRWVNKQKSRAPQMSPPNPYPRQRPITAPNIIKFSKFGGIPLFRAATKVMSSVMPIQQLNPLAIYVAILSLLRGDFVSLIFGELFIAA